MPTYKLTYTEYHRFSRTYTEEFDISSIEQWTELKSRLRECMDESDLEDLPKSPPRNIKIWLNLYKNLSATEYNGKTDVDWITDRKGGYGTTWVITDSEGKRIVDDSRL